MPSDKPSKHEIARLNTLRRLETKVLAGVTNYDELAAAFGVSPSCIREWLRKIKHRWAESHKDDDLEDRRLKRIRQFERLALHAINGWERSRVNAEEFVTHARQCTDCRGTGERTIGGETEQCEDCEGTGQQTIETTRVRGQAGDPAMLRLAKDCFAEAAKLEGLLPGVPASGRLLKRSAALLGDDYVEQIEELYYEAPAEAILRAKVALEELRAGLRDGTIKAISDGRKREAPG